MSTASAPAHPLLRRRALRRALCALTLTSLLAAPLAVQQGAPAQARDVTSAAAGETGTLSSVTVRGRGFGHGRGMSQWGAQGAALQGRTASEILAFYYPGTDQTTWRGRVRVRLTAVPAGEVQVQGRGGLRLVARGGGKVERLRLPAHQGTWRVRTGPKGQQVLARSTASGWRQVRSTGGVFEFRAPGPVSVVSPGGPVAYRGGIRAVRSSSGVLAVNVVSMNNYLRGVVPAESPASWQPAALQAQATAARTYALNLIRRARSTKSSYDVCDTIACQVYAGVKAEAKTTDAAIRAANGVVLTRGGAPILAEFSASSGGQNAGTSLPYQVFQADPWDSWSGNPVSTWSVKVPAATLARTWPSVGAVTSVRVSGRDGHGQWGGRATQVSISGPRGTVRVSGVEFRRALSLRSEYLTILE